ncbi:MAG: hypothetical protein EXX96DRAFT_552546 [Benjaminiella poitrasii]|nr:MAG: hypothetical protein EXX96DRAFT_552546 [Benjaminiella poitrasii]
MMSELALSNSTNHYDYTNETMMLNINPSLVQKSNSTPSNEELPPITSYEDNSQQNQYTSYSSAYAFQSMSIGFPSVPSYQYPTTSRMEYFDDPSTVTTLKQPNSPESTSTSSPPTPPLPPNSTATVNSNTDVRFDNDGQVMVSQAINNELITPLISSVPQSLDKSGATSDTAINNNNNVSSRFDSSTTARVKEMITRANAVPIEFYHTEFLEYSKETYEKKKESKRNKRKRHGYTQQKHEDDLQSKKKKISTLSNNDSFDEEFDEEEDMKENLNDQNINLSSAEIRRQIHIQSEQKRRAQIKDGFDELRKHLPGCNSKKMSKAALLTRTVQQLQHLKSMQNELLSEVERLLQENESLKKFQHGILQRQAMEKMYTF